MDKNVDQNSDSTYFIPFSSFLPFFLLLLSTLLLFVWRVDNMRALQQPKPDSSPCTLPSQVPFFTLPSHHPIMILKKISSRNGQDSSLLSCLP